MAQLAAQAVTVQEIYSFPSIPTPNSVLVQDAAGALYGTTSGGGVFSLGTVFRATTNGSVQTLVSFDSTNGASPNGNLVLGENGALYGTTSEGGNNHVGTVFRVTTNGVLTTLASFDVFGSTGAYPWFGLIRGADGAFYGTTEVGRPNFADNGTVFRVTTNGALTVVASFGNLHYTNGYHSSPVAVLALGNDGSIYGATILGGSNNAGTIFRVTTNGTIRTLASFTDTNGPKSEVALTLGRDGLLYGTTLNNSSGDSPEHSTLFRVNTNGELTTLVTLTNQLAFNPGLVQAGDGNFYGTMHFIGPTTNPISGPLTNYLGGAIFRYAPDAGLTLLSTFANFKAQVPALGLTLGRDGALYGTATYGGEHNYGAVFRATTNGDLTAVASFTNSDGADPWGGLTQGKDGRLYGTTEQGGGDNCGTLFRVSADGTLTTLVNFDGENGSDPNGDLVLGPDGALYGTTMSGGTNDSGTVFRFTTNGILATLASFDFTNGYSPTAVISGGDGFFYGATYGAGTNDAGSIFRVATNGDLRTLAFFSRTNGASPLAALALGIDGALYGTTYAGGLYDEGTVFRVTINGDLTTLVSFDGTNGAYPETSLTLGEDGAFYGTTAQGGSNDSGTVFRVTTNGVLTSLVSFSSDGPLSFPYAKLIPDGRGAFYGDAWSLFRVTTNGILTALTPDFQAVGFGNLIRADDGWFYGTSTSPLGSRGGGDIFRMNPAVQMLPLTNSGAAWNVGFNGIPGDAYRMLRATNLFGLWETLALTNITADVYGNGQYRDVHPPPGRAFYRTETP